MPAEEMQSHFNPVPLRSYNFTFVCAPLQAPCLLKKCRATSTLCLLVSVLYESERVVVNRTVVQRNPRL